MYLTNEQWARFILRFGLAFVFLYAAYISLLHTQLDYMFVPGFISQIIPIDLFLRVYGIFEISLALWLLSGKLGFYSALVSAGLIISLTTVNISEINTLFRNVAIITGAITLAVLSSKKTSPSSLPQPMSPLASSSSSQSLTPQPQVLPSPLPAAPQSSTQIPNSLPVTSSGSPTLPKV
jgi:hypothetical protein